MNSISFRSKFRRALSTLLTTFLFCATCSKIYGQQNDLIVRISEIEIDSSYIKEYYSILKEEAEASIRLEKGVISIFPMYQKERRTQVRILEIYANIEAYQAHIKTPHFLKYKNGTLKMVKSLKLVDMEAADTETMSKIFSKKKATQ